MDAETLERPHQRLLETERMWRSRRECSSISLADYMGWDPKSEYVQNRILFCTDSVQNGYKRCIMVWEQSPTYVDFSLPDIISILNTMSLCDRRPIKGPCDSWKRWSCGHTLEGQSFTRMEDVLFSCPLGKGFSQLEFLFAWRMQRRRNCMISGAKVWRWHVGWWWRTDGPLKRKDREKRKKEGEINHAKEYAMNF